MRVRPAMKMKCLAVRLNSPLPGRRRFRRRTPMRRGGFTFDFADAHGTILEVWAPRGDAYVPGKTYTVRIGD